MVLLNGVAVDAPLGGTILLINNNDQPGVIGAIGTILGRHNVNIANFALGRGDEGAVGVVTVDELPGSDEKLLAEVRALPTVRNAWIVRL
jgi:D-3-phosphoglycerate dehydrogenase